MEIALERNMKRIAILGSTGSIGTQTLEIVRSNPDLEVVGLAAGTNVDRMEEQIREFRPEAVCMWKEEAAADLRVRVADLDVRILSGMEGLLEIASMPRSQVLVTGIVGMIGIRPTIAAIQAGKDIALANKETLVTAGHIIMPLAEKYGVKILPVDSEHSAIFQSLRESVTHREKSADSLRRARPGTDTGTASGYPAGGCSPAPQLEYGTQGDHRFLHPCE